MFEKYLIQIQLSSHNLSLKLDSIVQKLKKSKLMGYPFDLSNSDILMAEVFPRDLYIESFEEQQYLIWSVKQLVIASNSKITLKRVIKNGQRRYFILFPADSKDAVLEVAKLWNPMLVDLPELPYSLKENIFQDIIETKEIEDTDQDLYSRSFFISKFPNNYLVNISNTTYVNPNYLSTLTNITSDSEIDYVFELIDSNKYSTSLGFSDFANFPLIAAISKLNTAKMEQSKASLNTTAKAIAEGSQAVWVTVNVKLTSDSIINLLKTVKELKNRLRVEGAELTSYRGEQLEAYCGFDPRSRLKIKKNVEIDVLLDNATCLFPFKYVSQGEVSGIQIGLCNGSKFYFDTTKNDVRHILVLGDSGMGKSQLLKNLVKANNKLGRYQLIIDGAMTTADSWDFDPIINELNSGLISSYKYNNNSMTQEVADNIYLEIQTFYEKCMKMRAINQSLEFIVVIDECINLLKYPKITKKVIELSKAGRKSSFSLYGATHDLLELSESGARSLKQMFDICFMFKTKEYEYMKEIRFINQNEADYLAHRDTQKGQALVKVNKFENKTDMSYRVTIFKDF